MRQLAILLAAPALTGCLATQGALEALNVELGQATEAATAAKVAAENPEVTQAEVDALFAQAIEEAKQAKEAAAAIPDAMRDDLEGVKETGKGILGAGAGVDGGILGLAFTAAAWLMRDRRKKLGLDPLQRSNVPTPPTTT